MSYRLDMPTRKRPTPEDAATARRVLLGRLGDGTELFGLLGELEPLHPRHDTFPGEVFLRLAGDALDWSGASRADPLALEGIRERFLPGCSFRGRQNQKLQFAVLAAAALHGGTEPDLRSPGGKPTTSGGTPCSQRSPTSAPPPTGPACPPLKHARNSRSAQRIQRHDTRIRTAKSVEHQLANSVHNGGLVRHRQAATVVGD